MESADYEHMQGRVCLHVDAAVPLSSSHGYESQQAFCPSRQHPFCSVFVLFFPSFSLPFREAAHAEQVKALATSVKVARGHAFLLDQMGDDLASLQSSSKAGEEEDRGEDERREGEKKERRRIDGQTRT